MRLRSMLAAAIAVLLVVTAAYAATLNVRINTHITGAYRGSNDLGAPVFSLDATLQPQIVLVNGTGNNQSNLMFSDTRTLAASATENLDLAGALTDPLGNTLTFATVKVVRVCADATNTNNVVVGGAASNTVLGIFSDATDKVLVKPGGCFIWVAPLTGAAVTAATGDILLVANSAAGTGVTYSIIIIGI